jgi:DnaJ-class molecular chaperone
MERDKRTALAKIFKPEKYGMVFCPDCKGKGKLPQNPDGFNVCSRCGGNGLVIKKFLKRIEDKRIITASIKSD